jgi:D-alanine-D-alanine ligase-like ATP-grasp enzyme
MSGTNVWLKLRKSKIYEPKPYLLDFENNVWELPYSLILNHTVEEIIANAKNAVFDRKRTEDLINHVKSELMLDINDTTETFFFPKNISFNDFIKKSKYVFLGLHGGDGENGNIQKLLAHKNIKYNGSNEITSKLCMDKFEAGELIRSIKLDNIGIAPQKVIYLKDVNINETKKLWKILKLKLSAKTLIVKPKDDGCSTGVAHLFTDMDLENYLKCSLNGEKFIEPGVLKNQKTIIEMPNHEIPELLFEKFIETDSVSSKGNKLSHKRLSGWMEVTIGILEVNKKLHAFNPSITIAEGEVLSLEEKFQGGTGINITPPPKEIVKPKALVQAKKLAEKLANEIGIKGYARIDAFMNINTGALLIIEVNTLPGLTPSTVIYHQALSEKTPIFPRELLEKIIKNSGY